MQASSKWQDIHPVLETILWSIILPLIGSSDDSEISYSVILVSIGYAHDDSPRRIVGLQTGGEYCRYVRI